MVGMELVVGYLFAWAVGKAKRVAGRVDEEVDGALDAGMDRLHDVVLTRLGTEPALERMVEEAGSGLEEPTARTRQRLELALEDAAENDTDFAGTLRQAVEEVEAVKAAVDPGHGGPTVSGNTFNGPTAVMLGDHGRQDNHFGSP
ncbi:chromosome partitioning protein [Streptomyces sp. CBMA156]|uniref:chromosome partitioning protein n=1 Tax=Streptomyces sp. CBMA156 TaxID=1930280 RepID=UPI001661BCE9|nr:chromosome partitioning protein [Streptomyces sp. CBMA156]MBD0671372.1 hypothetical protein [Streptomyces sp. CBMA156]